MDAGGTLTWTPAQVFDVDLLLLHAGRLPDQTGVVVGVAVGGAHRVLVVTAAVDVTYTPEGGFGVGVGDRKVTELRTQTGNSRRRPQGDTWKPSGHLEL